MNKKYKLDKNDAITVNGRTLYRIVALIDIEMVSKGDKGGYIETENNLSQLGNSWIFDDARVYDNAHVCDDAIVRGNACVSGYAYVSGGAVVRGNANIYEHAAVSGDADVGENARVYGYARIYGLADIGGNAEICGSVYIRGDARIGRNAEICDNTDYFCAQSFGSTGRTTTFYREANGWRIRCGCFEGSVEEFRKEVKETHEDSLIAQEYLLIADLMELRIKRSTVAKLTACECA